VAKPRARWDAIA